MKAMIFAAGLGSRLKPLTNTIPKALVPVSGKPLLEHVILKLKDAGCTEMVVNVHHFAGQIIRFLQEKENFGLEIHISDERDCLLETGGGLLFARRFFAENEPVLVHNVDIISNLDIADFYNNSLKNNALATLLVSRRETSRYLLNENGALRGWVNVKTGETKPLPNLNVENYDKEAFAGIHVFSPKIFDLMEKGQWNGKFSIIDFYLAQCRTQKIALEVSRSLRLLDVGKTDTLHTAEQFLKEL